MKNILPFVLLSILFAQCSKTTSNKFRRSASIENGISVQKLESEIVELELQAYLIENDYLDKNYSSNSLDEKTREALINFQTDKFVSGNLDFLTYRMIKLKK